MKTVEELQDEFLDLKFGMFIHYNMATYHDKQWVEGYPSPAEFNPGGTIDTDAWADAAKAAGMSYAVLTAKHVGGFCLWDSEHTDYSVMHPDCPYGQDVVAQFVESFTSRGLKVGLYYCWRNPGFADKFKVVPPEVDPATHALDEQNAYQIKQITELIQKFPDTFYVWNDGLDPRVMSSDEANTFARSLGDNVICSANWWDWAKKGEPFLDVVVSEGRHLRDDLLANGSTAETCWCLEESWFGPGAPNKTAEELVSHIRTANTNNANFLLNVGPDRSGSINPDSVKILEEIGRLL